MAIFPTEHLQMRYVCYQLGYIKARLSTLCTSSRINKWSKKKPVKLTQEAANYVNGGGKLKDYTGWEKSDGGYYGFSFPIASPHTEIVNGKNWEYAPPTGGTRHPFILGSFAGYNPDAVPFIASRIKRGDILEVNALASEMISFRFDLATSSASQIGYSDFANTDLGEGTFCALFYDDDTYTSPHVVKATGKIKDGVNIVDVRMGSAPFNRTQIWRVFLAISAAQADGTYYPIPYNDAHYYRLEVKVSVDSPIVGVCNYISKNYNVGYEDIRQYQTSGNYFRTLGSAYFKLELTVQGDTAITVNKNDMNIDVKSFFGTNESVTPTMYNSSFSEISSIKMSPGIKYIIYVGSNNLFNLRNGSSSVPEVGTKIESRFSIKWQDTEFEAGSLNVTAEL